jgi:DnaK suppressor protein
MQKKATAEAAAKSPSKTVKSAAGAAAATSAQRDHKTSPGKAPHTRSGQTQTAESPAKRTAVKSAAKAASPKGATTTTVTKPPAAKPAKEESKTVAVKKAEATAAKKATGATKPKVKADRSAFFAKQRELLLEERQTYIRSAEALKAQADSLALEHEPGDVQFDEEGGEGGTANVDREIDLYLSAQARATVVEIDRALQKIDDGTYGVCEQCGDIIPEPRLQALPFAALCVTCKSGGLSSRR